MKTNEKRGKQQNTTIKTRKSRKTTKNYEKNDTFLRDFMLMFTGKPNR